MAARRPIPIRGVERIVTTSVDDPKVALAVDQLERAVGSLQERATTQVIVVDLAIGTNAIVHALGRKPSFVSVMPTVLDPAFAWRHDTDNPHLDRQVLIEVSGAAQPGAAVKVE